MFSLSIEEISLISGIIFGGFSLVSTLIYRGFTLLRDEMKSINEKMIDETHRINDTLSDLASTLSTLVYASSRHSDELKRLDSRIRPLEKGEGCPISISGGTCPTDKEGKKR